MLYFWGKTCHFAMIPLGTLTLIIQQASDPQPVLAGRLWRRGVQYEVNLDVCLRNHIFLAKNDSSYPLSKSQTSLIALLGQSNGAYRPMIHSVLCCASKEMLAEIHCPFSPHFLVIPRVIVIFVALILIR